MSSFSAAVKVHYYNADFINALSLKLCTSLPVVDFYTADKTSIHVFQKQLGYMAFCYSRTSNGITNFFFGVQGSRPGAGPDVVDREINNLIAQQHDTYRLLALGPEGELKFEEVKEALSNTVSIKPRTLWDKSQKLTEEIYSSTRDFDRVDKLLAAIKSMTAKNFLELYEKFIVGDTKRKISSQVGRDNLLLMELLGT